LSLRMHGANLAPILIKPAWKTEHITTAQVHQDIFLKSYRWKKREKGESIYFLLSQLQEKGGRCASVTKKIKGTLDPLDTLQNYKDFLVFSFNDDAWELNLSAFEAVRK